VCLVYNAIFDVEMCVKILNPLTSRFWIITCYGADFMVQLLCSIITDFPLFTFSMSSVYVLFNVFTASKVYMLQKKANQNMLHQQLRAHVVSL